MFQTHPEASLAMVKAVIGFAAAATSAAVTNAASMQTVFPPALLEYGAWGIFSACLIYAIIHLWRANVKLHTENREMMERQIERLQEKLDEIEAKRQG